MLVSKWGNSLAVRLPKALVEQLGLKEGDELNVVAAKDATIAVETREQRRQRALDELAQLNWRLPADYRFDRDEANERLRATSRLRVDDGQFAHARHAQIGRRDSPPHPAALAFSDNPNHHPSIPPRHRGTVRGRHEREAGCGGR